MTDKETLENLDFDPLDAEQMPSTLPVPLITGLMVLFCIAVIGGIVSLVWFSSKVKSKNSESRKRTEVIDSYASVIERGTGRQLRDYSERLRRNVGRALLTQRVELLNLRLELSSRILEVSQEPEYIEYAQLSQLESLSLLNDINIKNGLPFEATAAELTEKADQYISSSNQKIRAYAHLSKILMAVLNFTDNKESLAVCLKYLDEADKALTSSEIDAARLYNMIRYLNETNSLSESDELKVRIAKLLLDSDLKEARVLGAQATDLILDKRHSYMKLLEKMEFENSTDWLPFVELYLGDVLSSHSLSVPTYLKSVLFIESIYRAEKTQLAREYLEKISAKVAAVDDDELKSKVGIALDAHKKRVALIGKKLELDCIDFNGLPLAARLENHTIALLVFTKEAVGAMKYIQAMNGLTSIPNVKFVAIGIDQNERSAMEPLAKQFELVHWVAGSDAESIRNAVPITYSPYLILLDRNGVVQRINVGLGQMRPLLKELAK